MGDEVFNPPPPSSFVYGLEFIYLCIISHQCNASESIFNENLVFQDILIHQKAIILVNALFLHMQQVCGTIWRHYNDDFISSDLFGQKFLND